MVPRLRVALLLVAVLLTSTGCGVEIPADPDGTLERVQGDVLRVGVSAMPPWTSSVTGGEPDGVEIALIRAFAESLGSEVEWTEGGEEHLVSKLERGELDVVVGGITASSPWADKAALTRPYVTVTGADGQPEDHVMLSALGENAFLAALERFLLTADVPL